MIIQEIYVGRVLTFKSKHDPPVAAYCDAPKTSKIARKSMKPKAWQVQRGRLAHRIERKQDTPDLLDVRSWQASLIIEIEELLESTMPKPPDHQL